MTRLLSTSECSTTPKASASAPCSAGDEIKDVIAFYESRGWDWSSVVCFLSMRTEGLWPTPIQHTRVGFGRPRKQKQNDKVSNSHPDKAS